MQNRRMNFSYKHRFLIPVVALSAVGIMACIVRSVLTGVFDMEDSVQVISCLVGSSVVCAGRRRAYRWITFHNFDCSDHVCYWFLQVMLSIGVVFGFLRTVTLVRIVADVWFGLTSIRLRHLLIEVRRGNPYIGPIQKEKSIDI